MIRLLNHQDLEALWCSVFFLWLTTKCKLKKSSFWMYMHGKETIRSCTKWWVPDVITLQGQGFLVSWPWGLILSTRRGDYFAGTPILMHTEMALKSGPNSNPMHIENTKKIVKHWSYLSAENPSQYCTPIQSEHRSWLCPTFFYFQICQTLWQSSTWVGHSIVSLLESQWDK